MLYYFNGNIEIVIIMILFFFIKWGDFDLVVNDEYEVIMIFEFFGIFVRIGLIVCLDFLF